MIDKIIEYSNGNVDKDKIDDLEQEIINSNDARLMFLYAYLKFLIPLHTFHRKRNRFILFRMIFQILIFPYFHFNKFFRL